MLLGWGTRIFDLAIIICGSIKTRLFCRFRSHKNEMLWTNTLDLWKVTIYSIVYHFLPLCSLFYSLFLLFLITVFFTCFHVGVNHFEDVCIAIKEGAALNSNHKEASSVRSLLPKFLLSPFLIAHSKHLFTWTLFLWNFNFLIVSFFFSGTTWMTLVSPNLV